MERAASCGILVRISPYDIHVSLPVRIQDVSRNILNDPRFEHSECMPPKCSRIVQSSLRLSSTYRSQFFMPHLESFGPVSGVRICWFGRLLRSISCC